MKLEKIFVGYKPHQGLCLEQIKNSGAGDGSVAKSAFHASSRTYILIPSPHVTVMAVCCHLQSLGAETGRALQRPLATQPNHSSKIQVWGNPSPGAMHRVIERHLMSSPSV